MGIFFRGDDISPGQDMLSRLPHLHLLPGFTRFVTYLASGIKVALSDLAWMDRPLQEVAAAS